MVQALYSIKIQARGSSQVPLCHSLPCCKCNCSSCALALPSSVTLHQLDLEHEEVPMTTADLQPPLPQPLSAAHLPGFRAMRWPSVFKVAAAVLLLRLLPDVPLQLLASSAVPRAAPSSSVLTRFYFSRRLSCSIQFFPRNSCFRSARCFLGQSISSV